MKFREKNVLRFLSDFQTRPRKREMVFTGAEKETVQRHYRVGQVLPSGAHRQHTDPRLCECQGQAHDPARSGVLRSEEGSSRRWKLQFGL